jgi:Tat protein translocase TatB subunit
MFNIGGGELIVIMLIALIVLGPQRLPDAARQIGKTMGDLRRLSTGFQNEMKSALDTADDPTRVAARRNPLAAPSEAPAADEVPVQDAIAQVSAQPSAPAKTEPPARATRAATKKAGARKTPLKAAPAPKKATAKTTAAKKSTTAAKKTAVPKAAPRRSKA